VTIWKFPLEIKGQQVIRCPAFSKVLSVQIQYGSPVLWMLVEPSEETVERDVFIFGTGHPCDITGEHYVGTVQQKGGALVWHVFVR